MAGSGSPGETSVHKAAAVFDSAATAQAVADRLRGDAGLAAAQVRVVDAATPRPGRALEPESRGIFRLMLRAHAALGAAGFVLGLVLFAILYRMGIGFVVNAALPAAGAIVFFCTMGGLMLGGLTTLRPDHDPYILTVLDACRDGRAAVVVHGRTAAERDAAADALRAAGGDVVRTL